MEKKDMNIIKTILLLAILLGGCFFSAICFNGKATNMENCLADYITAYDSLTDPTDFEHLEYTIEVNHLLERIELANYLFFISLLVLVFLAISICALFIFRSLMLI